MTTTAPVAYAGIATRGVAFVIDAAIANAIVLVGAGVVRLLTSLVGELRPDWLLELLGAVAWATTVGLYFVSFWTVVGQTPGMRVMRLRVVGHDDSPPRVARSFLRLVGLLLAIVPLFAGFLPVLFDRRRRGFHDFLAGTVVVYGERAESSGQRSEGGVLGPVQR